MKLKINHIILYPANKDNLPRQINFDVDKVNVITGYSKRGKSAIISIIDYCLGSKSCDIPIGTIQENVDIFALIVTLGSEKIFIARDCPKQYQSTDVMYFHSLVEDAEQENFFDNHWISNAEQYRQDRKYIKNYLGVVAGFENISEVDDFSNNGFDAPASFRDTAAFQFQPQNIIANPTTMFYDADSFEHLKRLRMIIPLILGYKSYEILKAEKEIETLEKDEREKSKKIEDIKTQYENWQTDLYEYYSEALKLGLTNEIVSIDSSKVDFIRNILYNIVLNIRSNNFMKDGSTLRYAENLEVLEAQRLTIIRSLDDLGSDLAKLEQFDKSKQLYVTDVAMEIDNRLKPIQWFLEQKGTDTCPFCDSKSEKAVMALLDLKTAKDKNSKLISEASSRHFSFEQEKGKLKVQIKDSEKQLVLLENNIKILIRENETNSNTIKSIYQFGGKIENVLENISKISPSSALFIEIDMLRKDISTKKAALRELKDKFDKDACLNKVSSTIQNYLKLLPIENSHTKRVIMDADNATIKVEDSQTRTTTFLSRIGSGSNHMCYHIATILGLHEYFLGLTNSSKTNYIPSFIVLDQPSQVYFPEHFNEIEVETSDALAKKNLSEDILNTSQIFKCCSEFMNRTEHQTQIIILEHAPPSTWKGIENVHLVEEWRDRINDIGHNALIPKEWLANPE